MPVQPTRPVDVARKTRHGLIQLVEQVSPLTSFGELMVSNLLPRFQYAFPYDFVFPEILVEDNSNGGTVAVSEGVLSASSNTAVGGTGKVETRKVLYYRSGMGGMLRFTTIFSDNSTSNADGYQYVGLLSDDDGYAVGYRNGEFGFLHRIRGVDTFYPQTEWTIDQLDGQGHTSMAIDPSKGNIWQIQYQYLGFGIVVLSVADPQTGKFEPVFANDYVNKMTGSNLGNPSLPFRVVANNGTSTTNFTAGTASCMGAIEGDSEGLGLTRSTVTLNRAITTTETPLIAIRARTTIHSVTNRINSFLESIKGATNGGNRAVVMTVYKNSVVTDGAWSDVDTNESSIEVNTTMTVGGTTLGRTVGHLLLPSSGNDALDTHIKNITVTAGETIVVTAQCFAGGTNDGSVAISWREEL